MYFKNISFRSQAQKDPVQEIIRNYEMELYAKSFKSISLVLSIMDQNQLLFQTNNESSQYSNTDTLFTNEIMISVVLCYV